MIKLRFMHVDTRVHIYQKIGEKYILENQITDCVLERFPCLKPGDYNLLCKEEKERPRGKDGTIAVHLPVERGLVKKKLKIWYYSSYGGIDNYK